MQNLKPLASLYSWAGQFESYLVADSEDRFSRGAPRASLILRVIKGVWEVWNLCYCLRFNFGSDESTFFA